MQINWKAVLSRPCFQILDQGKIDRIYYEKKERNPLRRREREARMKNVRVKAYGYDTRDLIAS